MISTYNLKPMLAQHIEIIARLNIQEEGGPEDSIFYDSKIAELEYKNRIIKIYAVGEIEFWLQEGDSWTRYKSIYRAPEDAWDDIVNDRENVRWEYNNWFEFEFYKRKDGVGVKQIPVDCVISGCIAHTVSEAIEKGITMIRDDDWWARF